MSTRAKNRQELLIKKILYIIFINRDYKIDNFGPKIDYLDLIVGAESRSLCSDWGLKKEDYILLDIVGADIWLKHGWDTNWDLQYGLSHSSKELDLYKRGVPEVDLINDFVFTVVDKFK